MDSDRSLRWDACLNVRDLGGLPAATRRVRRGALVRADSLTKLTDAGRAAVLAYGVRTVIDLRSEAEAAERPNPFADGRDLGYRLIPQQNEGLWQALSATLRTRGEYDSAVIDHRGEAMVAAARAVADATDGAVVVHCVAGKDRTGLTVALLLGIVGVSAETIAQDYALSHEALRPEYEKMMTKATTDAERERLTFSFDARAESIHVTLRHLETRHGGAEAYLRGAGLDDAAIERIRARLLD
ncbi:MAG TPA: tyrosine-protein phosphatase [Candidatus Limnocylindria bacterium]|nr:tyrosine-protein phosphatase [Candidatus Limnocylindria bacterium]